MLTTEPGPGASNKGVTWLSCKIGKQKDPEKPQEPKQPQYIQHSAVTFVIDPNWVVFSNPCDKFK